jgi:hypothetical protein
VSREVFDDTQLSAMGQAIDQIMQTTGEGAGLTREEVAHVVFVVACENSLFDPASLAKMARENLALRNKLSRIKGRLDQPRPARRNFNAGKEASMSET